MKEDDGITLLPGGETPNAMKEAVRNMKKGKEDLLEYHKIQAELHWAKYSTLLKEGFTSEQALELCKTLI